MIGIGSPQFMFMAEAEGCDDLVSTRTAKLNAVINDVKAYPAASIPQNEFEKILYKHSVSNLTSNELAYIQSNL